MKRVLRQLELRLAVTSFVAICALASVSAQAHEVESSWWETLYPTVTVSEHGELAQMISEAVENGVKSFDELQVIGKIDNEDLAALRELSIGTLNLSDAEIPNNLIPKDAFASTDEEDYSLFKVCLPMGVTKIGEWAFYANNRMVNIILPPNIESIGDKAFANCVSLGMIGLPKSLKTLGAGCFSGFGTNEESTGVKVVYCEAMTPPECGIDGSDSSQTPFGKSEEMKDLTLVVPVGTVALYKDAWGWSSFGKIIEANDPSIEKYGYSSLQPAISKDDYLSIVRLDFGVSTPSPLEGYIELWSGWPAEEFIMKVPLMLDASINCDCMKANFDYQLTEGQNYTIVIPEGTYIASDLPLRINGREEINLRDLSGIDEASSDPRYDGEMYDLMGRRVANPQPGSIYIVNGHKFVTGR